MQHIAGVHEVHVRQVEEDRRQSVSPSEVTALAHRDFPGPDGPGGPAMTFWSSRGRARPDGILEQRIRLQGPEHADVHDSGSGDQGLDIDDDRVTRHIDNIPGVHVPGHAERDIQRIPCRRRRCIDGSADRESVLRKMPLISRDDRSGNRYLQSGTLSNPGEGVGAVTTPKSAPKSQTASRTWIRSGLTTSRCVTTGWGVPFRLFRKPDLVVMLPGGVHLTRARAAHAPDVEHAIIGLEVHPRRVGQRRARDADVVVVRTREIPEDLRAPDFLLIPVRPKDSPPRLLMV